MFTAPRVSRFPTSHNEAPVESRFDIVRKIKHSPRPCQPSLGPGKDDASLEPVDRGDERSLASSLYGEAKADLGQQFLDSGRLGVLGTKRELEAHAALMLKFPGMEHDEPYMAHVRPGQRGEIVWTFNRAGEYEFACLIAGHYQAGMFGRVTVE